jgi:hypothetical protein
MRLIDVQLLDTPFFGVRQMTWHLTVSATCVGVAPACLAKSRDKCRQAIPSEAASSSTLLESKNPSSMRRMARPTVVSVPCHAGLPGAVSGRQRKQGLKPARSAAAAVG